MIDPAPLHEPTPEDGLTRDKWARTLALVYGAALLGLVVFAAAHGMYSGLSNSTAVENGRPSAGQAARSDVITSRSLR